MGRGWKSDRRILRESVLALLVLALAFLNFGHTSAVFAAGGRVVVTAQSICGDPPSAPAGDHFACHACRPAAAALPPVPCGIEPVRFASVPIVHAALSFLDPDSLPPLGGNQRGPPAI